jgi:hypothetical protein
VLAWRDLRGGAGKKGTGKKVVWDDLPKGIPSTREAWIDRSRDVVLRGDRLERVGLKARREIEKERRR